MQRTSQRTSRRFRDIVGSPHSYLRRRSVQTGLIVIAAVSGFLAIYPGTAQGQRVPPPLAECSTGAASADWLLGPSQLDRVNLSVVNIGSNNITVNMRFVQQLGTIIDEATFVIEPGDTRTTPENVDEDLVVRGVVRILEGAKDFSTVLTTLSRYSIDGQAAAVLEHCQEV